MIVYENPFCIIEKLVVGQLGTNCYLLIAKKTNELVIIDPGDDAQYIIDRIETIHGKPQAVILTHGHFDHVLSCWELEKAYTIPSFIHPKDRRILLTMKRSAQHFLGREIVEHIPDRLQDFPSDNVLTFSDIDISIVDTPGHTPGGVTCVLKNNSVAFTGDTVFTDGAIGEYRHNYSSYADLIKSIKKILSLPDDTILLPGHGEETSVKREKQFHA